MNKKYFIFVSILSGLYTPYLIFQFLTGEKHLFLFIINYILFITVTIGAYGLSKEYNPNESLFHSALKRYKLVYLLSFIPLIILIIIGNSTFTFSDVEIQNCKKNMLPALCISQIAIERNDYTICDKSYPFDDSKRDDCLSNFAKISGKIEVCEMLSKKVYYERSDRDQCLIDITEKHNSIEACDIIQDPASRSYCWFGLALTYGNSDACANIKLIDGVAPPPNCDNWFN